MEGFARPAPVAGPAVPISDPTIEYAAEVKPGKPDIGLDPDYTPPSTFDFGTVTEKPSGQVKPGKPDMGLMEYPEEDGTLPSTFDFGTVTEKPTGEVKPGKPDMGLLPDEQIEERAEPMDVTGDDDAPVRKLTQDQKYALVGLLVMGLLATYYKRR